VSAARTDPITLIKDFLEARSLAAFAHYDVTPPTADMRESIEAMERLVSAERKGPKHTRRGGAGKPGPVAHYLDGFEVPVRK
jgi:hypothetical protein